VRAPVHAGSSPSGPQGNQKATAALCSCWSHASTLSVLALVARARESIRRLFARDRRWSSKYVPMTSIERTPRKRAGFHLRTNNERPCSIRVSRTERD
jgi:hypothetical protein